MSKNQEGSFILDHYRWYKSAIDRQSMGLVNEGLSHTCLLRMAMELKLNLLLILSRGHLFPLEHMSKRISFCSFVSDIH